MKIGISVSIFCYDQKSLESTVKTLDSLQANCSEFVTKVVLVDDQSPYEKIHEYYENFGGDPRFEIVRNEKNIGIGRVKNQGLRRLRNHDLIVLSDNDVQFMKGWDTFLMHAMLTADVKMVSLSNLWGDTPGRIEMRNKIQLHYNARLNGAFIAIQREVLEKVGGYPDLPEKYGQEHCNWQLRTAKHYGYFPNCIDIGGLKDYLVFDDCPSNLSPAEKKRLSNRNAVISNEILKRPSMYNGDWKLEHLQLELFEDIY